MGMLEQQYDMSTCSSNSKKIFFEERWIRSLAFSQSSLVFGAIRSLALSQSIFLFDALRSFFARQRRRCSAARALQALEFAMKSTEVSQRCVCRSAPS